MKPMDALIGYKAPRGETGEEEFVRLVQTYQSLSAEQKKLEDQWRAIESPTDADRYGFMGRNNAIAERLSSLQEALTILGVVFQEDGTIDQGASKAEARELLQKL